MNTEHQALSTSWMSQRTEGIGPKYKYTRTYKKGQSTLSHLTAKARMTEKAMYVENRRHGGGLTAQQGPLSTSCHSPCGKWATCHQNSPCELKTVRGCASCGVTAQACVGKGCLTETTETSRPWLPPSQSPRSLRQSQTPGLLTQAPDRPQPQGLDKEICPLTGSLGDPYAHRSLGVPSRLCKSCCKTSFKLNSIPVSENLGTLF